MANRIKGITVEIGGDTTGLDKALKSVNSSIKTTQSSLKDVNRLLKLDPKNTELLSQKQKLLKDAIGATKEKLDSLKQAQEQAKQQLENGDLGQDKYDALQREIVETEQELQRLQQEAEKANSTLSKIDAVGQKMETVGNSIAGAGITSVVGAGIGIPGVVTSSVSLIGIGVGTLFVGFFRDLAGARTSGLLLTSSSRCERECGRHQREQHGQSHDQRDKPFPKHLVLLVFPNTLCRRIGSCYSYRARHPAWASMPRSRLPSASNITYKRGRAYYPYVYLFVIIARIVRKCLYHIIKK